METRLLKAGSSFAVWIKIGEYNPVLLCVDFIRVFDGGRVVYRKISTLIYLSNQKKLLSLYLDI